MPFWLKNWSLDFHMDQCASGECLARAPTGLASGSDLADSEGVHLLWILLAAVFAAGVITGWLLHLCWVRLSEEGPVQHPPREVGQLQPSAGNPWARLTNRALHFVRHRRRVAVAFNHLKESSLRNAEGFRPNKARLAVGTPQAAARGTLSPLREGPVFG